MAQVKSLKSEILERLNLKHGMSHAGENAKKAIPDFVHSKNKRFSGKSKQQRINMALGAAYGAARETAVPKVGDSAIYEGKSVKIRSLNESGMAVIRFGNNREVIVRSTDLKPATEQLTEGFLGMAVIGPTYREPTNYGFMKLDGLDPEDIGLIREDDETGEQDEQEEDHDNGSNVRHDGHTGKSEVDSLPTPSDTIAPAYSDEKAPKHICEPLSIHTGAEDGKLWQEPDWDGYDYPADAPEIPEPAFDGDENGNSRAPNFGGGHDGGDGIEDRDEDLHDDDDKEEDREDERTDETYDHEDPVWKEPVSDDWRRQEDRRRAAKKKRADQDRNLSGKDVNEGDVTDPARKKGKDLAKMRKDLEFSEGYFMSEMDDMLGKGEDKEPTSGDTITVSLPAMAAILCTVAGKVGENHTMLKAIVEALAEVSKGKTIEMGDLDAVAAHVNGEEEQEIENREAGHPDHEGMGDEGHEDKDHDGESWPGDGEKTPGGKTKLMADYFGGDDVMEATRMTDDEEIELLRSRAFPNKIRRS